MPHKDPEVRREYMRKRYAIKKDEINQYQKNWRDTHQEQETLRHKIYYENNKEDINEKNRINGKLYLGTEHGFKMRTFKNWRRSGIIYDDYDELLDTLLMTWNCNYCDIPLEDGRGKNSKNLDHDHETGEPRGVICKRCNLLDVFKNC